MLRGHGHDVVGLDSGFYRDGCLYLDPLGLQSAPSTVYKDLRLVTPQDFEGFDAVIHLAELSNDPLGQNRPEVTFRINHEGSVRIAQAARAAGVKRFVYASSCSVYGLGSGEFLDETAPPNPQTAYAQCKVLVERDDGCPITAVGHDGGRSLVAGANAHAGPGIGYRAQIRRGPECLA